MRLRTLVAAAFVQRLRHRVAWRRHSGTLAALTVAEAVAGNGVQEWLLAKCVHEARRPRRPELIKLPGDAADSSSDEAGW